MLSLIFVVAVYWYKFFKLVILKTSILPVFQNLQMLSVSLVTVSFSQLNDFFQRMYTEPLVVFCCCCCLLVCEALVMIGCIAAFLKI